MGPRANCECTFPEKLYVMRMSKMSHFISLMEASGDKDKIYQPVSSTLSEPAMIDKTITVKESKVCFPHESTTMASEQHVYNSFYICKTLTVFRNNKTVSEAELLNKQFGMRQKFVRMRNTELDI